MSSDESTATQFSEASQATSGRKPKVPPPDQWEINLIGNFLLTLYHRLELTPDREWMCKKSDMRNQFRQFVTPDLLKRLQSVSGTDNIGTLLQRCRFLINTPRKSSLYKINIGSLFEFRNRKLCEQDKRRINDDEDLTAITGPEDILKNLVETKNAPSLQVTYEVDENSPVHALQYEGTVMQERRKNYFPTNMSCFICQEDFSTMVAYEEHIQIHNDESDFEYLKQLSKFQSPVFTIDYQLCKNSHNFCFNLKTITEDLIIERIIIVQSRSMFYVHNMRVPYAMPESNCDRFYVDSHLFTMFVEQPIVIVCHLESNKNIRIIEEHHFMRISEYPRVNFPIKPYQLPSNKTFKPLISVPDYFPPMEIRDAIKDDFIYEKLMKTSNEFREYVRNEKILQPQTIGQTLTTLLHIEDMDTIKEYLDLMQQNVSLRGFDHNYNIKLRSKQRIHIENLLSVFDDVIITTRKDIKPGSDILLKLILQNKDDINPCDTYLGHIEDVSSGRVTFRCYKKLDLKRSYTIIFRPSRTLLRYQYRAMELLPVVIPHLSKFLFPTRLLPKEPSTISLRFYNKSIVNNPEQMQAVRNIAEGPRNDATYIIFGPPGTGKTTTLVESILQVLQRENTKILVTASSNSACDEVALRLCQTLSHMDMSRAIVRIYAQTSEARLENFDDLLLEHSNLYKNVHFYPDIEVLHEYRIVVCTMSVVAKLATGKFGRTTSGGTLYTHLFIDEVAAATEVETLMPITSVLTPKACLIIAGDHKQLGPIVKSKRAEEFNLGVSLMDRLLKRECYSVNTDTGDYDRSIQTRLRMNFRSHPAIVNLYSGMYYNHALDAKANIDDVSLVKDWHLAPNKDFPIIFHYVNGNSCSDFQSYSLHNSDEINVVMHYVKDLMYFGVKGKPVKQSDIGIISPYKKQYLRIREELNQRRWYEIETGSVENFQGKEKSIIIVSFVRSNTSTLGFLDSPRRLNVTLSRAKSLLILIGNARTLSMNPDFDYIIKECQRHQTFVAELDHRVPTSAAYKYGETTTTTPTSSTKPINKSKDEKKPMKNFEKVSSASTLDLLNDTLKELKLKNQNENAKKPARKIRARYQSRAAKKRNSAARKNNENITNEEDNDDDDDDDVDAESDSEADNKHNDVGVDSDDSDESDSEDNEPSTSKAAGKAKLSRSMKKKQQKSTNDGKTTTNNDLDAFFSELPSVPKSKMTPASTPKSNTAGDNDNRNEPTPTPIAVANPQNPHYNNGMNVQFQPQTFNQLQGMHHQMPGTYIPPNQNYNNNFQQNGLMFMQTTPRHPQYPPSYFQAGLIGMPQNPGVRPQIPSTPFTQRNLVQNPHQQLYVNNIMPGFNPMVMQQQQQPQQHGNNTSFGNQPSTKADDVNNIPPLGKNASRAGGRQKKKKNEKANNNANAEDANEKNNQKDEKKDEAKPHLGQTMKKKNPHQNVPKASKALKTVVLTKDGSNTVEIKEHNSNMNATKKKNATSDATTAKGSANQITTGKNNVVERAQASAKSSNKDTSKDKKEEAASKVNKKQMNVSLNVQNTNIKSSAEEPNRPMSKKTFTSENDAPQNLSSLQAQKMLEDLMKVNRVTENSQKQNQKAQPKPVANIKPIASTRQDSFSNKPTSSVSVGQRNATRTLGATFNEATLNEGYTGTLGSNVGNNITDNRSSVVNNSNNNNVVTSQTGAMGNSSYNRGAANPLASRMDDKISVTSQSSINSIANRPSSSAVNSLSSSSAINSTPTAQQTTNPFTNYTSSRTNNVAGGTSAYTSDVLHRPAARTSLYASNSTGSALSQERPNSYEQPNRPVRDLNFDKKPKNPKNDNCVIA